MRRERCHGSCAGEGWNWNLAYWQWGRGRGRCLSVRGRKHQSQALTPQQRVAAPWPPGGGEDLGGGMLGAVVPFWPGGSVKSKRGVELLVGGGGEEEEGEGEGAGKLPGEFAELLWSPEPLWGHLGGSARSRPWSSANLSSVLGLSSAIRGCHPTSQMTEPRVLHEAWARTPELPPKARGVGQAKQQGGQSSWE